jgi:hypothetical protein
VIVGQSVVDICVDVGYREVSFIYIFWKRPHTREVLPNFFVDKLVLFSEVFLAVVGLLGPCHVATALARHSPASLTPQAP